MSTPTAMPAEPPVSVLGRATLLLRLFRHDRPVVRLTDLVQESGLPKTTVHRLVTELCSHGVLDRVENDEAHEASVHGGGDSQGAAPGIRGGGGGGYRLGGWLFELGEMVPTHRTLGDAAQPIMEDLREATHQRIHLAVLDGVEVVYVNILGARTVDLASRIGGRFPAHASGVGKAILAYSPASVVRARIDAGLPRLTPRTISTPGGLTRDLQTVRTVGMAVDKEEAQVGVSCVAAPVFGSDRKVRAALSITGMTRSIDPAVLGPAVRTAAFTLSRTLRTSGL